MTASQFVLHIFAIEDLGWLGHHNPKALLSWSRLSRMRNSIALRQRVAPFYHENYRILHTFLRLLRKDWAGLQRQLRESFNRCQIGTLVYRRFSTAFAFEQTSGQWTRDTEDWMSAFSKFLHHLLCHSVPFTLWTICTDRRPLVLWTTSEKWPLYCFKSPCK